MRAIRSGGAIALRRDARVKMLEAERGVRASVRDELRYRVMGSDDLRVCPGKITRSGAGRSVRRPDPS